LAACKKVPTTDQLIAAIRAGDTARTKKLLQDGAKATAFESKRRDASVLCIAAACGNLEIVKLLLTHGADKQAGDPLSCAVVSGQPAVVRELLAQGAKLSRGTQTMSLLSHAAESSNVEIIEMLLAANADVNVPSDGIGYPPITLAAGKKCFDCVKRLAEKGAIIDRRDKLGCTALFYAACNDDAPLVEYLLSRGANPLAANRAGHTPAFRSYYLGLDNIQEIFRKAGVKQFGMLRPPDLAGGGLKVRIPVIEVEAR
jgi:ankyrin repeat protein